MYCTKARISINKCWMKKAAFVTANMMTGMFDTDLNGYTSVTGRTITDHLTRTYAGKSGTTSADSWMIGFNPKLVMGVWTGYDKTAPSTQSKKKLCQNHLGGVYGGCAQRRTRNSL